MSWFRALSAWWRGLGADQFGDVDPFEARFCTCRTRTRNHTPGCALYRDAFNAKPEASASAEDEARR